MGWKREKGVGCSMTTYCHLASSIVIQFCHPSSSTGTVLLSFSTEPILINNLISDIQNWITVSGIGYQLMDDGFARYWHWVMYRMMVVKPYLDDPSLF